MLKKSTFLILLIVATFPCCQTNGQNNSQEKEAPNRTSEAKSSPSWRRPIPPEILAELPLTAVKIFSTDHFDFLSHGDADAVSVSKLADELEHGLLEMNNRLNLSTSSRSNIELYPSSEIKGLILKNNSRSQIDSTLNVVHLVWNGHYGNMMPSEPLELMLRRELGEGKVPAMACGMAILFTPSWQRLGHRAITARLINAGLVPDLNELLNMELWSTYSDIIAESLTASFAEFLLEQMAPEQFKELYKNGSQEELKIYEPKWKEWLQKQETPLQSSHSGNPTYYFKGFNFAHEGYQIYNGYGSRLAMASLENAKAIGCNTMAIIPYSFLRNANEPAPIPIARFAGGENDESVIASCHQSKELGLYTLLKPQIWLGRGQWPGDVEMTSENDWELFFKFYTYWIAHYALLAEIHQVDGLCLGTELSKTTLQRPDDWKYLVNRIRRIYSGDLTYASNWGEEFEKMSFWNEFDYIGLNCYYPLSSSVNATDQDLRNGIKVAFNKAAAVSRKFNKPVVLTEMGFPSTTYPWIAPHQDGRDMAYDLAPQERCFRLFLDELSNVSWCKGLFIWKWPSYPRSEHGDRVSFHISGQPAETVIGNWFKHQGS